mmetsp:Transcript_23968/g.36748  ORF Transcript_23968/g.36748 Transcript_23968/m.36748 type:complete len:107 (+) Transcript_23968:3858-4178(+)
MFDLEVVAVLAGVGFFHEIVALEPRIVQLPLPFLGLTLCQLVLILLKLSVAKVHGLFKSQVFEDLLLERVFLEIVGCLRMGLLVHLWGLQAAIMAGRVALARVSIK